MDKISKNKLVIITGPNASGKSSLSVKLAERFAAEIVSADSRQVYKGLDLGSGKITKDEMHGVPHYLLDVAEPNEFFTLVDFQTKAYEAIDDVFSRNKKAFLAGGTGLYVNSIADGYNIKAEKPDLKLRAELNRKSIEELISIIDEKNPSALKNADLKNKQRLERSAERALTGDVLERVNTPRYDTLIIGVSWPRDVLYERIRIRLDKRLDQGMIDEVRDLRSSGATDEFLYGLGLEYRYILMYLRGEFDSFDAFYNKLFMEIRHLAKEQMTWFRKRKDINWVDMTADPLKASEELIENFYRA